MSESLDRKYCFLGHFFVLKVRIIFLDTNIVFSLRKRQKIYRYYYTKLPVITVTWGKIHCLILWCMFPWKGSWHTKHSIFFAQHLLGRKGAGVYSTYLPHVLVMYKARFVWSPPSSPPPYSDTSQDIFLALESPQLWYLIRSDREAQGSEITKKAQRPSKGGPKFILTCCLSKEKAAFAQR